MPPDVVRLLVDLRAALDELGVRWFVFGAQAVIAYGVPRLSDDVDVTIELGSRPTAQLVEQLTHRGFRLLIDDDVDSFVAETRVLPFTHDASGVDLDVVLAGPGLESVRRRRKR